jgi:transcription elongation factor Elf1
MAIKYFKPDVLIDTRCEHCGAQHKETLERLYSEAKLICSTCGNEHTTDRGNFRRTVEETEAFIDKIPNWPLQE